MCFQVLEKSFEYRERSLVATFYKFIERCVFDPFLWFIYLLFRYYHHFNFLVCKSVLPGLPKELIVGTTLHQCLVLWPPSHGIEILPEASSGVQVYLLKVSCFFL